MKRDSYSSGQNTPLQAEASRQAELLRIMTLGFSSRARTMIEMFVAARPEAQCEFVDVLESAEAGIVDLDGPDAAGLFAECRQQFFGPIIVLSVRQPSHDDVIWVSKPVRPAELIAALETARSQRVVRPPSISAPEVLDALDGVGAKPDAADSYQVVVKSRDEDASSRNTAKAAAMACTERRRHPSYGNLNDEDYAHPERRHKCFYDPGDYFQGALEAALVEAKTHDRPLRIVLDGVDKGLIIFPNAHRVQCDVREQLLRNICMIPGGSDAIKTEFLADDVAFNFTTPEPRLQYEDSLLWKVALWSSFGRVPLGTEPENPVQLEYWPNFTRIFIPHHSMQIAALWSQRQVSLLETASILDIEYRYVFSVYSAALAIGAVAPATGKGMTSGKAKEPARSGLFKRLLNYLGASN